jgi:putative two-component system response regulator
MPVVANSVRSRNLAGADQAATPGQQRESSAAVLPHPLTALSSEKFSLTRAHCERLATHAVGLGRRLGLSYLDLEALRLGALLHDIGKIAIPAEILEKSSELTAEEREIMRLHPVIGERMCAGIKLLEPVLPIIRHHHEHFDGSGYPDRLVGEQIPLLARIVQIADVYDALTTARCYKVAWSPDHALSTLEQDVNRGWYDARLFGEFSALVHNG